MKKNLTALLSVLCLHMAAISSVWASDTQTGAAQSQEPARNNYIRTTVYTQPGRAASYDHTQYFNGLGYPTQTVGKGYTPQRKDLVTLHEYDTHGRLAKSWLPIPTLNNTGACAGTDSLKTVARAYFGEPIPYTETVYDKSTLGRVSRKYKAGAIFREKGRSTEIVYDTNQDAVKAIQIDPDNGEINCHESYPANSLLCTITTNEDGNRTEVCTDQAGRVVRVRQILGSKNLDTYYGYDMAGRLAVVVTPSGATAMVGSYPFDSSFANTYCYTYRYDDKGNLVEHNVPGGTCEQFRYDSQQRLVRHYNGYRLFNGNLCRQYTRLYTYDELNRVTNAWILYSTFDRFYHSPDTYLDNPVTEPVPGPSPRSVATDLLSATRYDNYDQVPSSLAFEPVGTYTSYDRRTKGLKTYEKMRIVDDLYNIGTLAPFIERAFYYDTRGLLLQCVESMPDGGSIRTTYGYNFQGQEIYRNERVRPSSNASTDELTVQTAYDHAGRIVSETAELNSSPPASVHYMYDEQGRVGLRRLGPVLENREYNLQGWLTALRSQPFTSLYRYYDPQCGTAPSYSGNIAEWDWRHGTDPVNTYAFTYDALSRLIHSAQYVAGVLDNRNVEQNIRYDSNGNLRGLDRYSEGVRTDSLRLRSSSNRIVAPGVRYDNRGNLMNDGRSDFDITYNLLNLPYQIRSGGHPSTTYLYAADGTKYSVLDQNGSGLLYRGSLVYSLSGSRTLTLESASFSAGCILAAQGTGGKVYTPIYYLTDHLGSVRCIVDNAGNVLERNDYYPFGKRVAGGKRLALNRHLYNGKEEQWAANAGLLDYGARLYNPALCCWLTPDPLAHDTPSVSPYAYCAGNPVKYIDPDGRIVRLANNYAGGMENIAKIAATSLGSQVMSHLIGRNEVYTLSSTFLSLNSSYNYDNRGINYVANPWYSEIPFDGGALNSMIAMGHETFHAFDHSYNVFNSNNAGYSRDIV